MIEIRYNALQSQPAFLICTGPTIKQISQMEWQLLGRQITFAVSGFAHWLDRPIHPTFWGVNEEEPPEIWQRMSRSQIFAEDSTNPPAWANAYLTHDQGIVWFKNRQGIQYNGNPNLSDGPQYLQGLEPNWTHSVRQQGCSVLKSCLQPALWLGCNPIYFIGLDLSMEYVYGGRRRDPNYHATGKWHEEILAGLTCIKERLAQANRQVYNLSPETYDTVLPRLALSDVLRDLEIGPSIALAP